MRSLLLRKGSTKGSSVDGSLKGDSGNEDDEFHDTAESLLHHDAHEEGGYGFTNKELLAKQRSVVTEVIKEIGKKLLSGHLNLVNVSLPVKLFEPRSYLEKLTDVWVHPKYLRQAAEVTDPLTRLQHTVTWYVAGLQHTFQSWRKPFNPILGETFQAALSDGSQAFLEQISHHPPISAYQLEGPDGLYQFSGVSQPDVSFELKANSVRTVARGERRVVFHDGGEIEIAYPTYYMRGLLYTAMPRGDMTGTALFLDKKNRLQGEVVFGRIAGREDEPLLQRSDSIRTSITEISVPEAPRASSPPVSHTHHADTTFEMLKRRSFSGFTSILGRGESSHASCAPVKGRVLLTGCGNWLSYLDWGGQRCWTLVHDTPESWGPVADPLPSDARFREDLQALKEGNLPKAQAAKEALEQRQREDAKLRKPGMEALGIHDQRSSSLGH